MFIILEILVRSKKKMSTCHDCAIIEDHESLTVVKYFENYFMEDRGS